ncbi:hypothetical protein [Bacillus thuringiensis]|uniref:hypothetical protein n=1 Tax=Bacillus thuringiensis TaxID=1428 RepID=UPI0011A10DB4|nr:hypothetical protein [Bacillus thuringiensis]
MAYGLYYGYGYGRRYDLCNVLNIRQGDRIIVRSAGHIIETVTFIRTESRHIVRIDQNNNFRATDLATIDVAKTFCCDLVNEALGFVD